MTVIILRFFCCVLLIVWSSACLFSGMSVIDDMRWERVDGMVYHLRGLLDIMWYEVFVWLSDEQSERVAGKILSCKRCRVSANWALLICLENSMEW